MSHRIGIPPKCLRSPSESTSPLFQAASLFFFQLDSLLSARPHVHGFQIHASKNTRTPRDYDTAEQRGMSCLGWEGLEISWDPVLALSRVEGGPECNACFLFLGGLMVIVKSPLLGYRGLANSCCNPLTTLMRWVLERGWWLFCTGSLLGRNLMA